MAFYFIRMNRQTISERKIACKLKMHSCAYKSHMKLNCDDINSGMWKMLSRLSSSNTAELQYRDVILIK